MVAGQVKIREVMFEYKSKVQKTTLNLAADNFVEGGGFWYRMLQSQKATRHLFCIIMPHR